MMKKKWYPTLLTLFLFGSTVCNERIHRKSYTLNIPSADFIEIKLQPNNGAQLPLATYPELGKHAAFRLIPTAGKPIDIVIQTEYVSNALIRELDTDELQEQGLSRKQALKNMKSAAETLKAKNQGLQTIYRAMPTAQGIRYKLLNVAIPGTKSSGEIDNEAVIVATPKGNLQLFPESSTPGVKDVIELDTRLIK